MCACLCHRPLTSHRIVRQPADLPSAPLQLLHCIENSATGGESTLLDGFKAASDLAQADPASFALLASTPVTFTWQGREGVFLSATKRTITLEPGDGVAAQPPAADAATGDAAAAAALPPAAGGGGDRLSAIYYDNRNVSLSFAYLRSGPGGGGADKALLRAYRTLAHHFNTPRNKLAFKMVPGDVLVFNNKRCLHGRESFDPRTGGRLLEGCYMDGDMVLSRARGLTRKLAHELDARFLAPKHLAEDEERRDAGVRRAAAHV
jgi:gamma-butyrobetaine dioxygenase